MAAYVTNIKFPLLMTHVISFLLCSCVLVSIYYVYLPKHMEMQ